MSTAASYGGLVGRVITRPGTVVRLLRAAWRFRARGWYRRPPFLPLPPAEYIAWRLSTAYGDAAAVPAPAELDRYLRWAERMRTLRQNRRG